VTLYNFTNINVTASFKRELAAISWKQNGADIYELFGGDTEGPAALFKSDDTLIAAPLMISNVDDLPHTRTTILNCSAEHPDHGCVQGSFNVRNFLANGPVIEIVMEFLFERKTISKLERLNI
jgi:hypothetical protein